MFFICYDAVSIPDLTVDCQDSSASSVRYLFIFSAIGIVKQFLDVSEPYVLNFFFKQLSLIPLRALFTVLHVFSLLSCTSSAFPFSGGLPTQEL